MARSNKSRSSSNRGPASDKIDSVSEDLNTNNGVEATQDNQATNTGESQEEQTLPTPPIDSPEDVDDQSGTEEAPGPVADEEDDEEEEPAPAPTRRGSAQSDDEEGMGFPRKGGKTLSIMSGKPHETVRNVGGVMVPLTMDEAVGNPRSEVAPKTDAEIIEKLKKLGKWDR